MVARGRYADAAAARPIAATARLRARIRSSDEHHAPTCPAPPPVAALAAPRRRRARCHSLPRLGRARRWTSRCSRMRSCRRCTRRGCAAPRTGWTPRFAHRVGRRIADRARCRCTRKRIRYGEYVFDWALGRCLSPPSAAAIIRSCWRRFRLRRSPGPRLLAPDDARARRAARARAAACSRAAELFSRCTCCFRRTTEAALCAGAGMLIRHGVAVPLGQCRLSRFRRFPRRVQPRQAQEGEAGAAQGSPKPASRSRARRARDITGADWAFFYRVLRADLSTPTFDALSVARILRAHRRDAARSSAAASSARATAVASARRSTSSTRDTLWGRYWGATEYVPGLHFEACYYQAIEFCIERASRGSKAARRACTSSRAD